MVKTSPKYLIQIHKVGYVTIKKKNKKLSTMLFDKVDTFPAHRVIVRNKPVEALCDFAFTF